jgi:hypothetical protein
MPRNLFLQLLILIALAASVTVAAFFWPAGGDALAVAMAVLAVLPRRQGPNRRQ